ncbi:integrase core domain-containing protein, partial [Streptomyces lydicus]|uniref:integrase core domain-containing protein n=1 Tax=Streptomyces lydicus TaxID=47763 RepID=UPI003797012E
PARPPNPSSAALPPRLGDRSLTILDSYRSIGKVERFNRTLLDEWAYLRPYTSNTERTAALDTFLHNYNHHRCHTALGGKPPISRVNNPADQYT